MARLLLRRSSLSNIFFGIDWLGNRDFNIFDCWVRLSPSQAKICLFCRLDSAAFSLPLECLQLRRDSVGLGRQRERGHSRRPDTAPPGGIFREIKRNHSGEPWKAVRYRVDLRIKIYPRGNKIGQELVKRALQRPSNKWVNFIVCRLSCWRLLQSL